MTRLVYMADSHIKTRTWTNDASLTGDAFAALEQVQAWASSKDAFNKKLMLGGDLLDSNRPSSLELTKTFSFLQDWGSVWYIRGNHDNVVPPFIDGINELGYITVLGDYGSYICRLDDANICGIPWQLSSEALMTELREMHACICGNDLPSYVMLHTGLKELMGFDGTWQIDCDTLHDMFSDCISPVVFLIGHVHKLKNFDLGDGVFVHSPGSLYPCNLDEINDQHGFTCIDTDKVLSHVDVRVRDYVSVDWSDIVSLNNIVDERMEYADAHGLLPVCIRLNIDGKSSYRRVDVTNKDAIIRVNDETVVAVNDIPRPAAYALSDALREELNADRDTADMAVALLESDDPVAELESWLEQWNVERL